VTSGIQEGLKKSEFALQMDLFLALVMSSPLLT